MKKILIDIRHTHLKDVRNSFLSSLKKLPDIIHLRNLVFFGSILSFITLALFVQRFSALREYYVVEKPDFGGIYTEGVVGTVNKINPLFIQNDSERAASELVFSGLTRIENGNQVIPDIAKSWEVKDDGKTYIFKIRDNVKWHDGVKFSVEDIIYTVGLLQNPDTKTGLESVWKGVKVNKVSDIEVKFTLPTSYPGFLSVASQAMLPEHLLGAIDPKNIKIAEFNNNPVGTGPYKFVRFDQLGSQQEVIFKKNEHFSISTPYLDQIKIVMYENDALAYQGLLRKQIDGVFTISAGDYKNLSQISGASVVEKKLLPEYQMVYFNLKNTILADKDLRLALVGAVDRQEIIDKVLLGNGEKQVGMLLPGQPGYNPKNKGVEYNPEATRAALDKLGWTLGTDGIRSKEGKKLTLKIVYSDTYESREDAKLLKSEFGKVGVNLELIAASEEKIGSNYIKPRNFDLLLVTQNVGYSNDWYSLWDSSQVASPGMNASGFTDKSLDRFVQQVRKSTDKKYIAERLKQAEQIISDQAPVIYLYRPTHLSAFSTQLKGYSQTKLGLPTDAFSNVYKWYLNVKS